MVSFEKLHVVDLGITWKFCDLTNTVLQRTSILPLKPLLWVANDRFAALPCSTRLSARSPFQTTQNNSQAGIFAKIRNFLVRFLLVCVMVMYKFLHYNDPLLYFAFHLDVINDVLCRPSSCTTWRIPLWQGYHFSLVSEWRNCLSLT